jgi:hypothetical protein
MASWGFLTNHARALLCIAHDPGIRLRDIAARLVLSGAQDSFGLACSRRLPFRWGTSARRLDRRRHLADDRPGLL